MALTESQILQIINDTARQLGFDFTATSANLDEIGIVSPEQVNRLVDAINPIIHDKIMLNLGNRGFLSRFIVNRKGGSTSRHISFGIKSDEDMEATPNTLEALVGVSKPKHSTSIKSINATFRPYVTIDRMALAKVFTFRAMVEYIQAVEENIRTSIISVVLNKFMNLLFKNESFLIVQAKQGGPEIDDIITFYQSQLSGELQDNVANNGDTYTHYDWIVPKSVDRTLCSDECIYLSSPNEVSWYKKLHFRPEGLERYVVRCIEGERHRQYVIPINAIIIEEYNRNVEVQDVDNIPGRYNVFFNSDFNISIDTKYPIFCGYNNYGL